MKKIIGLLLLLSPFIVLFILLCISVGVWSTLSCFGVVVLIFTVVIIGVNLLEDSDY